MPDVLDAVEVLAPVLVVAALLHLVDARRAVVDRRDAVLDPGREHEVGDVSTLLPRRSARKRLFGDPETPTRATKTAPR